MAYNRDHKANVCEKARLGGVAFAAEWGQVSETSVRKWLKEERETQPGGKKCKCCGVRRRGAGRYKNGLCPFCIPDSNGKKACHCPAPGHVGDCWSCGGERMIDTGDGMCGACRAEHSGLCSNCLQPSKSCLTDGLCAGCRRPDARVTEERTWDAAGDAPQKATSNSVEDALLELIDLREENEHLRALVKMYMTRLEK